MDKIRSIVWGEMRNVQPKGIDWRQQAAKDIARAIAEKLREGVVWENQGTLEYLDREWFGLPGCRRGLTRIHFAKREEDEFDVIGHLDIWGISGEGVERVTVTVKEE